MFDKCQAYVPISDEELNHYPVDNSRHIQLDYMRGDRLLYSDSIYTHNKSATLTRESNNHFLFIDNDKYSDFIQHDIIIKEDDILSILYMIPILYTVPTVQVTIDYLTVDVDTQHVVNNATKLPLTTIGSCMTLYTI